MIKVENIEVWGWESAIRGMRNPMNSWEKSDTLRMIHVTMDIVAPLYWWKEFDTYKVGTVANSCSTMHKLAAKPFEMSDFSNNKLGVESNAVLQTLINVLNKYRKDYLDSKEKFFWWQMIQLLPSSYNQHRTVDFDYETAFSIIRQRTGHKLDEWNDFVNVLIDLPYVKDIGDLNGKTETVCD